MKLSKKLQKMLPPVPALRTAPEGFAFRWITTTQNGNVAYQPYLSYIGGSNLNYSEAERLVDMTPVDTGVRCAFLPIPTWQHQVGDDPWSDAMPTALTVAEAAEEAALFAFRLREIIAAL